MVELTGRQEKILKQVVEEYILTATPISSERIARRGALRVSSATVRNEMMDLEVLGLLTHPHTSAGRIPSDHGYRYYVDRLMSETALSPVEQQMVQHQFHQVEAEVQEWSPLAAAVMAQMARTAALATRVQSGENLLRRLELVPIERGLVLLVLVLSSGEVRQRLWRLRREANREELSRTANRLSSRFSGLTGRQIASKAAALPEDDREIALLSAQLMDQGRQALGRSLYYEGIGFVSGEPEFEHTARLITLMEALRWGSPLEPLLSAALKSGKLEVAIGSENDAAEMRDYSVIVKRYGHSEKVTGVVGLVGPTRMKYWRAVSLVSFVSDLLDRLVDQSLK